MRSLGRIAAAALAAATLAACTSANQRVAKADFGSVTALATTGSLRLVTERKRGADIQPVVCSEPSPDYAIAFGSATKAGLAVNGGVAPAEATAAAVAAAAGGPAGSGAAALDRTTTEFVMQGNGRAAAVLALRDGLYAACQSYANGRHRAGRVRPDPQPVRASACGARRRRASRYDN
jgi:hypothetical protein